MKLIWSLASKAHIESINDYLSLIDPAVAKRTLLTIQATAKALKGTPFIGRPGRVAGTRELIVRKLPFIIVYSVAEKIQIIAVFHQSMRWPDRFEV